MNQLQQRTHRALEDTPAVDAEITGIEYFEEPPRGTSPVVYLAVNSPGIERIHARLADAFDPVEGLEGPDYVPHVTLARGGDLDAARSLAERDVPSIRWTVTELEFFNGQYRLPVSRVSLPS